MKDFLLKWFLWFFCPKDYKEVETIVQPGDYGGSVLIVYKHPKGYEVTVKKELI